MNEKLQQAKRKVREDLVFRSQWNTFKFHSSDATQKHEFVKFILCQVLKERSEIFIAEADFNGVIVDVLRVTKDGEIIAYEIETGLNEKKRAKKREQLNGLAFLNEWFIWDPAEFSENLSECLEELRAKIV